MRTIPLLLLATAIAGSELRLGVALPGQDAQTRINDASGDGTTSHAGWSQRARYQADYLWSIPLVVAGFQFGPGIAIDQRRGNVEDADVSYRAYSVHLSAGPYVSVVPTLLHLELLGFAGLGVSRLRVSDGGGKDTSSARYWEYGANLNAVVTLPVVGLTAGAGAGWLVSTSRHDISISGSEARFALRNGAPVVGAFVGYRF